jgi:Flp pilus assembly protein TadG
MRRSKGEKGASLVEFALVLPLLATLVFGIIDFGFAFNSYIELRSGSREGARLAAVNNGCNTTASGCSTSGTTQKDALVTATRARTTGLANSSNVKVGISFPDSGAKTAGSNVEVCLVYPFQSVTGLFNFLNVDLKSKAIMRLEQTATFDAGTSGGTVTC